MQRCLESNSVDETFNLSQEIRKVEHLIQELKMLLKIANSAA